MLSKIFQFLELYKETDHLLSVIVGTWDSGDFIIIENWMSGDLFDIIWLCLTVNPIQQFGIKILQKNITYFTI